MKKYFKKILSTLIIILSFSALSSEAGTLKVEKFSMPVKIPNKISQPLNMSFATEGPWRLIVEPLDNYIRNLDNPNVTLPITRLEITELNGTVLTHFDACRAYEIRRSTVGGIINLNLALNVVNFQSDIPGNYVADLKFTLMDSNNAIVGEDIYSFRYMQEEIANLDFTRRVYNLNIDKDKALRKNSSQNLPMPLGIYVTCNKNWKLYVRKPSSSNSDKTLNYYVKILGATDSSVTCNSSNEYILLQDNPILVASGKSTINTFMNTIDKKLINVDYMVKGPEDKFFPSGTKSEDFEYRLQTED